MQGELQVRNTNDSFTFGKPRIWKIIDNCFSTQDEEEQNIFFITGIQNIALHKSLLHSIQ